MRIKRTLQSEMPIMKRYEAESNSGDEDAAPSPLVMPGNVSAAAVPAELRLRLDSGDHPGAALASSSHTFGGGGSTRPASPHAVRAARTAHGRALLLPARFRDAALIDPPKPASACGKLKNSVSRSSVTSTDSLPSPKEEPVELPAQEFGVGDIVWAKCQKDLSVWPAVVIDAKQRDPAGDGTICVMLFGCSRQRNEREMHG